MKTAAVLPSYKVTSKILDVLARIGPEFDLIYVVDDACPDQSGKIVTTYCTDPRVKVLFNQKNLGVGGAVIEGYRQALLDDVSIVVKIDADGQMPPEIAYHFINPIKQGCADYTKGNRFYNIDDCKTMPALRLFGNACLSFMNKLSSGYWDIFDPTNGYTAIHTNILKQIPLTKVAQRYFFESDLLFRLSLANAQVRDIPMAATYEDEVSNLKISKILLPFLCGHFRNTAKRIIYSYFLRDFSPVSLHLIMGIFLLSFGTLFGIYKWINLYLSQEIATSGTVMLAALPIILGTQFVLSFIQNDITLNTHRQK